MSLPEQIRTKTHIPAAKIFHKPCAFNPFGVSEEICIATTSVPSRNPGCCHIKCSSRLRACRVCIKHPGVPNRVSNIVTGLCKMHEDQGEEALKPAPPAPKPFAPAKNYFAAPAPKPLEPPTVRPQVQTSKPLDPTKKRKSANRSRTRAKNGVEAMRRSDAIKNMREVQMMSPVNIGRELGIHSVEVSRLYGLQRLTQDVRDLLDPERNQGKLLTVAEAVELSKHDPGVQLARAKKLLSGEISIAELRLEGLTSGSRAGSK